MSNNRGKNQVLNSPWSQNPHTDPQFLWKKSITAFIFLFSTSMNLTEVSVSRAEKEETAHLYVVCPDLLTES